MPRRVGLGRDVPAQLSQRAEPASLSWSRAAGGMVATLSVTSRGAAAVRLGLHVRRLPPGTELRFFSPAADPRVFGPFLPADVRSATAGEDGHSRIFWSPVIDGDTAAMEIFLQPGTDPGALAFTIARISHLTVRPVAAGAVSPLAALSCQSDVACHASTWGATALSVALYTFTEADGASYICSGTLLNNTALTFVPYFLSANHCVSTPGAAATMNTYWFYQRASCGGSETGPVQLTRGATLLATSAGTDSSFFRLNEPAPAGAWFSGWSAGSVLPGQSITGIHHPRGDVKKIAFGWVDGIACWGCAAAGTGSYLKVTYLEGPMEPGSSGSGLFTSAQQLVGVLSGATPAVCGGPQADWYGRFDLIYPSIGGWINPATTRILSLSGDLAFGAVHVGGLAVRTLVISNTGNAALTVSGITHPPGFSISWLGGTIPAGGSQAVSVIAAPAHAIAYGGVVTVHANHTAGANTIAAAATGAMLVTPQTSRAAAADFDADGAADPTVWRQATGTWHAIRSSDGSTVGAHWGTQGDVPVPGDYDADGRTDLAVWRPSTGAWHVILSATGAHLTRHWGAGYAPHHDVPVPGDYDGDGRTDVAVWRPLTGVWYVMRSSDDGTFAQHWGDGRGPYFDVPAAGDYDGDGRTDLAVWRRSTGVWYVLRSSDETMTTRQWGAGSAPHYDLPALGDYDNDGRTDFTVWRPTTGVWYSVRSSDGGVETTHWGAGYAPYFDYAVPGDYDGDGSTDVAVWRSSTGTWYAIASSDRTVMTRHWGAGVAPYFDLPIPSAGAR